jgi:hypothetical protein
MPLVGTVRVDSALPWPVAAFGVLLLAGGVGSREGHRRLCALSRHCLSSVADDGKSATVSGDSPGPGSSSMRSEADSVGGRSP